MSTYPLVVISPATITRPRVTSVSQATRPRGSCLRTSSRMLSEIWSHSLSGCPSVTDSEVKRKSPFFNCTGSSLLLSQLLFKPGDAFHRRGVRPVFQGQVITDPVSENDHGKEPGKPVFVLALHFGEETPRLKQPGGNLETFFDRR